MAAAPGSVQPFSHEFLGLPSGLQLEATLALPSAPAQNTTANKLAICLHPWSWLGGRMDDPVLCALERPLRHSGYYVLRYNSRGVGRSSGWPSLTGTREAQDLQQVLQYMLGLIPSVVSVVIVGYSHGSLIASLLPAPENTTADPPYTLSHVFLSYPLGPRSWLTAFSGSTYSAALTALLRNPRGNVLVLYGDADEFTSAENYDNWADLLKTEAGEHGARLAVVRVEGATHFWSSEENASGRMVSAVKEWLP